MKPLRLAGLVVILLLVLVLVGSLLRGLGGTASDPAPQDSVPDVAGERIRVEVLNAAGVPGLARAATERLRASGLDVVYFGNASGFHPDTSWVLDRVGRAEAAQRVADALEIRRVRTAADSTLLLDVSVILGRDWARGEAAAADSVR